MKFFPKNIRGETLAETLIALSILAVGITVASTVVSSSIQNLENTVNRIVATNLAREGLEAVHNIRETNWMKFSNDKRNCWNHLPQKLINGNESCLSNSITPGDYIVYLDTNKRWRLEKLTTINQDTLPVLYKLSAPAEKIDEIFNHIGTPTIIESIGNPSPADPAPKSKTLFKRIIHIEYLNNTGDVYGDIATESNAPAADYNRMNVSSKVTWTRNGQTFNAELKTRFSDYLGRENLVD